MVGCVQWELQHTHEGWTFRNKASGLYLSFEGPPRNGTVLVALEQPRAWDIWPDERNRSVHRWVTALLRCGQR
jgi:hypothetical protein